MSNQIIKDSEYTQWIARVVDDFKRCQVQAALRVNGELLQFYWNMGRDIESRQMDNRYGTQFYANASRDIRSRLNQVRGLSETNIRYAKRFYCLYSQLFGNLQQPAEKLGNGSEGQILQQPAEEFRILFSIPWTHHLYIIDKTKGNAEKAWFYVQQTLANNWSRSVLLNFLSTDLYERQGKAITNFRRTLPSIQGDLAQQMSKDPYCFDVLSQTTEYTEKELKDALESMSQPLGISEYALTKVYPEKFTSSLPSIEDIENSLNDSTK